MRQIQVGIIAYKNALTGEYEKTMPLYKAKEEQELKEIEEELLKSVCEFFRAEKTLIKNKRFKTS